MVELVNLLLNTGLLQFGRFETASGWQPYQLHTELIGSYPEVLTALSDQMGLYVENADHLVCADGAVCLGTALSLRTRVPLVYYRYHAATGAFDLFGAYDIGHPALLVGFASSEVEQQRDIVQAAQRVGLEINRILVVMDDGSTSISRLPVDSLFSLVNILDHLVSVGALPPGQADAVRRWLAINRRRPD